MSSWYAAFCWVCLAIGWAVPIIESLKHRRSKRQVRAI